MSKIKVWSGRAGERFKRDHGAEIDLAYKQRTRRRLSGKAPPASAGAVASMLRIMLDIARPCCIACGCTDDDCRQCVERTGRPCTWSRQFPGYCTSCVVMG